MAKYTITNIDTNKCKTITDKDLLILKIALSKYEVYLRQRIAGMDADIFTHKENISIADRAEMLWKALDNIQ